MTLKSLRSLKSLGTLTIFSLWRNYVFSRILRRRYGKSRFQRNEVLRRASKTQLQTLKSNGKLKSLKIMKKLLLFAAAATMLAACSTDTTEDVAQIVVPERLQVSIADEESRMQLSNEKTVWTAGDKVSVFYKSDANQCWKFNGKTGDRSGTLSCVSQGTETVKMEKVVIVYPYSESYMITPSSGNIEAKLPAVQKYMQGSYGLESSPMISSGYYTQFALKNVCGWLKLQLSGTGTITKITLKGNNGEQLAGDMYINADDATVTLASASVDNDDNQETGGTLVFEDSIVKEVELDCNGGVDLSGADVTPFYIALPPTVFEKGFTATLHFDNGTTKEIATSKRIEITRNHIVPMETAEISVPEYDYIDIKYVTSNKRIIDNSAKNSSWWASVVSNTYDVENNVGTLVIPKGSSIENNAFQNITELLSIEIPDSVTSINKLAFEGCMGLISITISDSVTAIGENAFRNCNKLTTFTIPDSVTSIGNSAFSYCHNLTNITIPDSIISIGENAFIGCYNLTAFYGKYTSSDNRCLIIDGRLIAFARSGLTTYVISNDVTSIGKYTFFDCSDLTKITIPDNVTSIDNYAFNHCTSLTNIYCKPTTPPTLGSNTFDNIPSSAKIYVPTDSMDAYKSATGWSDYESIIVGYTAIEPDNISIKYVTSNKRIIDNSAKNSSWWASVVSNTYDVENNVGTLVIPKGSSIGNYAFQNVTGLLSIEIPDNMKGSIGSYAFDGCTALKSITMSKNTSYIYNFAFRNCTNLVADMVIPNEQKEIYVHTFSGCSKLTNITIPDSVTSIGGYAFSGCSSLTSITIPDNVTSIRGDAFSGCNSLTSINIPDSVTKIEDFSFSGCSSLTSINIPDGVTSIENNAFSGCSSLTSINIPDGVTSIGNRAFSGCSNLTSITIPDNVISIGSYAFAYCRSLTSIIIPDNVTSIENSTFYGCNNLTSITIPDGVTSIENEVFRNCRSLTSITIPDSVALIGDSVFYDCSSLTSIYCKPTTPPSLGSKVFYRTYISASIYIYIPKVSIDAYKLATGWSDYADKIVGYDF